jgi:RimJ/RimL family protein N-acetyltransferase
VSRRRIPERVETERLVLRAWRPEDAGAWAATWADPDVWSALRPGAPFDPEYGPQRFAHHLAHWDRFGFGVYAAEEQASGEVAGWVGPSHPLFVPALADAVEIGWSLRRPFWGAGLATEGARAAAAVALEHLAVDEVISLILPTNARSIAVAERLGMRYARDARRPGIEPDLRVYAAGWQAIRPESSTEPSAVTKA